jgi:hypothetical protein
MGLFLCEGGEKGLRPTALLDGLRGEIAIDEVAVLDAARRAGAEPAVDAAS